MAHGGASSASFSESPVVRFTPQTSQVSCRPRKAPTHALARALAPVCLYLVPDKKIQYCWVCYTTRRLATLRSTAMLGPSHPDTNVRCTGDGDTPLTRLVFLFVGRQRDSTANTTRFFESSLGSPSAACGVRTRCDGQVRTEIVQAHDYTSHQTLRVQAEAGRMGSHL